MNGPTGYRAGTWSSAVVVVCALGLWAGLASAAAPPPAPPVTVDPTQPNLFYGAIPPNGPNGPVIVFVHGLDGTYKTWLDVSHNNMYDHAYQSGFRTVFLSLNLNNTPNSADIPTNAAMLQIMFPKILSQYGVSKVYFVCHSKGGLDLQAAIATPQWIGMAKAVITLGTPNQGDALADWLFSPAGQALGQALGLLTPGVQSLETANVLGLRTQWDPLFQNAHIPFYTLSGNTDQCQKGVSSCSTTITGPILTSLTGGTTAPFNDGLVDHPESLLPTTYAMELGIIHCNHYALPLGNNSFNYIYARVMALENEQPGFSLLSTGGFGDQHNTWAWSSAWFNSKLYVGTGREVYCVTSATAAIQLGIPQLYPPSIGDCTPDYHYLPLQAEIWQYDPTTQIWTMVYQSPNSLTTTDNVGNTVATARDIGFRGMTVVSEPDGTQALYAGGVTSGEIFSTSQGSWPPPRILRSVDGVTWNPLPQNPGSFLGNLTLNGTSQYPNYSIRSASQLNGVLFLQVGDFPGVGRVISSVPGVNPALGDNCGLPACFQWASPPTAQMPVWILENFNNFLYAGTGNPPGAGPAAYGVWKTDGTGSAPYNWTSVISNGGWAQGLVADYAMSLQIFTDPVGCPGVGCLYVGTDRPNEMVRIHPNDTWDLVVGNPRTVPAGQPNAGQVIQPLSGIGQYFNNGFTGHFWRMGVGGQGMYMGTWDWSADQAQQPTFAPLWSQEFGTDLWRTTDGTHWYMVSKIGLGDGNNTGSRSFSGTTFGLYMGTARSIGGTQVFMVDNSQLDYNHDGVIDQNDVNLMNARLNTPAQPVCTANIITCSDPMDLNQDGVINISDLRLLTTQCTYPGCAVPATLPPYITLPAPVLYSAPGVLGGPVTLSWNGVAGAKDYLVYRIALSPSQTTPPPAQLTTACAKPTAGAICSMLPAAQGAATGTTAYGFPGPPVLVTRVTNPAYSEASLSTLQALYFVRSEDASGNLSSPSNIVGGPSLAAQ